jgi:hypothetical protein
MILEPDSGEDAPILSFADASSRHVSVAKDFIF